MSIPVGPGPAQIQQDELQRSTERAIRAGDIAEHVLAASGTQVPGEPGRSLTMSGAAKCVVACTPCAF